MSFNLILKGWNILKKLLIKKPINKKRMSFKFYGTKPNKDKIKKVKKYPQQKKLQLKELGPNLKD
jgi:hypothetical protein